MWTRLRSVLGSAWRRPAWRRLCRPGLVPPLILLIAFLVFHMALRGSGQRLDWARWVLGPLVIVAAVAMGPLLSCRKRVNWPNVWAGFWLSLLFLGVAFYLIPLWAGQGCWAPDLATLSIYLLMGLILAVITTVGLGRLQGSRFLETVLPRAAVAFLIIFVLATGCILAVPGPMQFPPPTKTQPKIAWKFTPWEAVWASWASRLGWAVGSDTGYWPAPVGLGPDLLAFVGRADRLDVLDPSTGAKKGSISALPVEMQGAAATAHNQWRKPLVAPGHVLLLKDPFTIIIVDCQSRSWRRLEVEDRQQVMPAGKKGFYVLRSDRLDLIGWDGNLIRSFQPPPKPPSKPSLKAGSLLMRPYSAPQGSPLLLASNQGLVALQPQALYCLDPASGHLKWVHFPQGKFWGVLVSPDGKTVYAADAWAEGRQIHAYTSAGEPLWTYPLPAGCQQLEWQAFDSGLALAPDPATTSTVVVVSREGKRIRSIKVDKERGSSYYSLAAAAGVLLVNTGNTVTVYDPASGQQLWELESGEQRQGRYWYGYQFDHQGIAEYQGQVIIRDYRGVGAYQPRTGQPLWFYPGRVDSVEPGPEFLYVVTARGVFALANP